MQSKAGAEDKKLQSFASAQAANRACPYALKCGGCDYSGLPYTVQLENKQKRMEELLGAILKKDGVTLSPIVGADNPFHYRNKVHSVFVSERKKTVQRGIYEKNSHRVIDIKECRIENEKANEIMEEIRRLIPSFKIQMYDEDRERGLLRHVLIRVASKGIMVILVTSTSMFPGKKNFVTALRRKFPEITTVVQNINNKRTSMVLGERNEVLYGPGFVVDDRLGLDFRISPDSFYQVNSEQTVKLYGLVLEVAGLTGRETVWDLYCGTGTIGMFMASHAKEVLGVELNKNAVTDAKNNARVNAITNIRFLAQDATDYMKQARGRGECPDVLCMDPPRSGSTKEFIEAAAALKIPRIVYVSCGPESLARDLICFQKRGYKIRRAVPVDMFPQTEHVETVCLLSQRKPDTTIEVDLDISELEVSSAETKA